MSTSAIYGEMRESTFVFDGITFEVMRIPDTIWCGSMGYAADCTSEPDINAILKKYQSLCDVPKMHKAAPDWSCCISIDYWQNGGAPRGIMFAQQVLDHAQSSEHDVFRMPASRYIRVVATKENALAAFEKDDCQTYEFFGVIHAAMASNGYSFSTNGAQEIEIYSLSSGTSYAYVQVQ